MHSYHIFYFPFKWENTEIKSNLFAEQTNLDQIKISSYSNWVQNPGSIDEQEANELYNEKNYYYPFVHPVLYDDNATDSIMHHYKRKETLQQGNNISYIISKKDGKTYYLKVEAINLNLYATGVGMLTFFLINDNDNQKDPADILTINQYGRRIFPPFIADIEKRYEIAEYIAIQGLNGSPELYREDFSNYVNQKRNNNPNEKSYWESASFINNLIADLSPDLKISPVIDDRMFVNCWYPNNELCKTFKNKDDFDEYLRTEDFWYKYIYVDASTVTCKNDEMRKELLKQQTYKRWQKDGMLYGASRYSFVFLSEENDFHRNVLAVYMRTVYSRMVELILIQRASILKFSGEVTQMSKLAKTDKNDTLIIEKINSLYKEYIRFVNQIHFREVSAQDQGIELYDLMSNTLKIKDQVKDLDDEIEELYHYVSFLEEKEQNRKASILNLIAAIFLPATLFAGIFGMNSIDRGEILFPSFYIQMGTVFVATIAMYLGIKFINKKRR